jgi:hypothetical protein
MSSQFKISIPEPCHEDWDKMIPDEKGRFCEHCSKTVIDFTSMPPAEIKHFFLENRGKSICGRIKQSQLDGIVIQIPSGVLYSQTNYQHYFLLALFVVMGTTLFSCADKNGNKQKIDKIEIVEDLPNEKNSIIEDTVPKTEIKTNTNNPVLSKKGKKIKLTEYMENMGAIAIASLPEEIDNTIYGSMGIDVKPEFPGGEKEFYSFIKKKYLFPKKTKDLNGEMRASFTIDREGKLSVVKDLKNFGFGTGEELKRVLFTSPKWFPGEVNGKKVSTNFEIRCTITQEKIKRKFWFNKTISKIDSIIMKATDWDSIQKVVKEIDHKKELKPIKPEHDYHENPIQN